MEDYFSIFTYNKSALEKTLSYSKNIADRFYRVESRMTLAKNISEDKMVVPSFNSKPKWNTKQAIDFFNCFIRNKYYVPTIYCNQITQDTSVKQYSLATGKIIPKSKLKGVLSIVSGETIADMLYKASIDDKRLRNVVFDLKQARCIDASHFDHLKDWQIPIGTLLNRDNIKIYQFMYKFKNNLYIKSIISWYCASFLNLVRITECDIWVAKDLSPQQQEQWRYYIRKFY